MKKIFLILFLSSISNNIISQNVSFKLIKEYEDTLKIIAEKIMYSDNEQERIKANSGFITILKEVLAYDKSFKYQFDSLKTISILSPNDKSFKLYNWILRKDNGTYSYNCLIQYYNKRKKRFDLIELIDKSDNLRNPIFADLDSKNWYGALYYEIIYFKKSGRKFYTLLGWDGNDSKSTKKIIEPMYFSGKNKVKFGLPIFKLKEKSKPKRFILECDSKSSFSLKFNKDQNRIIFDQLVPLKKELVGMHEYYIPEGTYNAFEYNKGKWVFFDDIDARNKQRNKKNIKATKTLILLL